MTEAENHRSLRHRLLLLALVLLALVALALAWSWSPMRAWLDVNFVVASLQKLGYAFGPVAAVCGFALALTVAIPLVFLTLVALVAFGPVAGFGCVVAGALVGAAASYGIGMLLGREVLERLAGERINRLRRHQNIQFHHRGNPIPSQMIVQRCIPAAGRLQPVIKIQNDLVQRKFVAQQHARAANILKLLLLPALLFNKS